MRRWLVGWVVVCALLGCRQTRHRLPSSTALAGEVLVVGDTTGLLSGYLSQPEPGLPQPEPRFDVRRTDSSRLTGNALLARAIVIVGDKPYASGRDLNARPQIVIEASAADSARILRDLLDFEAANAYDLLRRNGNPEMEQEVRRLFGVRMVVPEEMRAHKASKDFLWMATNGAENIRSLCVMRIADGEDGDLAVDIDRALSHNIHGESPSCSMRLAMETVEVGREEGMEVLTGQWLMENDAMGGPLVAAAKPVGRGHIVILAFAYAPERKKRNIMRQLRAVVLNKNISYGQQQKGKGGNHPRRY